MAIATLDDLIGAYKQEMSWAKTASRPSAGSNWYATRDLPGTATASLIAGLNTTVGIKPSSDTDANSAVIGCLPLNAFDTGARGYLTRVEIGAYSSAGAGRYQLVDVLWAAGPFQTASTVWNLGAAPSFTDRLPEISPGVPDFTGVEMWVEAVLACPSGSALTIEYAGHAGWSSTTSVSIGGFAAGRMAQVALGPGQIGIRNVASVQVNNSMTSGAANILLVRPLWQGRAPAPNMGVVHDALKTGMPEVFPGSALTWFQCAETTACGTFDASIQIASK